jgi:uncharacterized protein (DUF1330 family)
MSAYIIAQVDVKDWDRYREYTRHTPRVIDEFGGRFIVRGGKAVTLEGDEQKMRIVVIEFPSLGEARAFYDSPAYAEIRKLRLGAGDARLVAVEGYGLEEWEKAAAESRKLG